MAWSSLYIVHVRQLINRLNVHLPGYKTTIDSNISLCLSGHSLDDKSDGHPISSELQSLTKSLEVMTDLANNLTAEYKKNFNLLFWKQIISRMN